MFVELFFILTVSVVCVYVGNIACVSVCYNIACVVHSVCVYASTMQMSVCVYAYCCIVFPSLTGNLGKSILLLVWLLVPGICHPDYRLFRGYHSDGVLPVV